MLAPRIRGAVLLSAMVIAAACGGSSDNTGPSGGTTPTTIAIVSGTGQVGSIGAALTSPLVVKVSASGNAVTGATVSFAVTTGTASVNPSSATTDANGQAQTSVTLGSSPGTVVVTASVLGTTLTTSFTITAATAVTSTACSTTGVQTIAAGGVLPGVGGSGICLPGGVSGADYALIAFNSDVSETSDDNLTPQSFTVHSTGAIALNSANITPASNFAFGPSAAALRAPTSTAQEAFDVRLRSMARTQLASRIPAARAYMNSVNARRPSFNAIPSTTSVGQILNLNANGNDPCDTPINIGARVVSISNTAIVVADTANPTGGFTDAEYASFGAAFDTLINPLDTQNFGTPTDIDHNGHILILFTKEVNKLTPPGSQGVIGGFFFERDLFPTTTTNGLQGCPTSNVGEMFYVLVPDPNGRFGIAQTKDSLFVNSTLGTLAHEYQHLINAGRRMYVNNADDFEEVWLNEGLSHIAEELLFYRVSGLAPKDNICASTVVCGGFSLSASNAIVGAFNDYQADNFGRYLEFLDQPKTTDVHGQNDSLQTRGATWNMLRYLDDHSTTPGASDWQKLVNSTTEGLPNLSNVFGTTIVTQMRDWATSVFSDDVTGVTDTRFIQPSWNMRDIIPRLCANSACTTTVGRFTLSTIPISDAAPPTVSVVAGGTAYLRFSVGAGGQASIDWSNAGLPVSSLMQFTVVRTR